MKTIQTRKAWTSAERRNVQEALATSLQALRKEVEDGRELTYDRTLEWAYTATGQVEVLTTTKPDDPTLRMSWASVDRFFRGMRARRRPSGRPQ